MSTRDDANAIVAYAFRNGYLEDLHADPDSRISNSEMKVLMQEAAGKMERLLQLRDQHPEKWAEWVESYGHSYCQRWDGHTPREPAPHPLAFFPIHVEHLMDEEVRARIVKSLPGYLAP